MTKNKELLIGWADKVEILQVRMDVEGKLGVVTAITYDSIVLQRMDFSYDVIPFIQFSEFESTTFSLGEL